MGINVTSPPFDKKHSSLSDVSTPHLVAEVHADVATEAEVATLIGNHKALPNDHHTPTVYGDVQGDVQAEIAAITDPENAESPDAEGGDWVTPSFNNASSGVGGNDIENLLQQADTYLVNNGNIRAAQKITLTGLTLESVSFYLKKYGNPTGTATAVIRKASDSSIIETSATTLDVSTLTTSHAWKEFPFTCAPDEEVYICIEYAGGNVDNQVLVGNYNVDVIDGVWYLYHTASYWTPDATDGTIKINFSEGTGDNLVDENTGTNWVPIPANEAGAWASFDIGSLKFIQGIRIYFGADADYRPAAYHIQISKDDSNWVTVATITETPGASAWKEIMGFFKWARYVKIVIDTHGASGTKIYEVDCYSVDIYTALEEHGHG